MNLRFPVPRITEGFMDKVIEAIGGRRLTDAERDFEQQKNADYIFPGAIAELKILEEEPLAKKERQDRIARFFADKYLLPPEVDIDIKSLNDHARAEYKEIIGIPIKKAVKKAAAQIKATKAHLGRNLDFSVLIAVNNGFSSLPHDEFDNLVLTYCRRETSQIDFILCTTVEYDALPHPGPLPPEREDRSPSHSNSRDWICRTLIPSRKAVLKTRAVQTLRDCRASPNFAKRLECGAFTAAFFLARDRE